MARAEVLVVSGKVAVAGRLGYFAMLILWNTENKGPKSVLTPVHALPNHPPLLIVTMAQMYSFGAASNEPFGRAEFIDHTLVQRHFNYKCIAKQPKEANMCRKWC